MSRPDELPKSSLADSLPTLRVAWWNTGLSAPGQRSQTRSRDGLPRWNLTTDTVRELLRAADLLVLGEIDCESLFSLCPDGFASLPMQGVTAKMGVVFDPRRVIIRHQGGTVFRARGRELRILDLRLQHMDVDKSIEVLAVHFPSHLREDQETLRRLFASDLSREIRLRRQGSRDAHLIVIGDFNDEPFADAMQSQLRGVRERTLVYADNDRSLLYNPFWRKLGERGPAGRGVPVFGPAGSHFYRKNAANGQCWYTYDQILVTAAFLAGTGWTLDEEHTDILCLDSLFSDKSLKYGLDHLPIVGKFSYLPERGALQ